MSKKDKAHLEDLALLRTMLSSSAEGLNLAKMPLKDLVVFGQKVWELSYKNTNDDHQALEMLANQADPMIGAALMLPDEQLITLFIGRWADQAFPRILVESKYGAMLMATDAKEEILEYVLPPWKAFLIEFQDPIIECFCDRTQKNVKIIRILVQVLINESGTQVWNFVAAGESGVQLWRHGLTTSQLLKIMEEDRAWEGLDFVIPIQNKDERAMLLVGRLIISTCLAMSDPNNFHEQKTTKGRGRKWHFVKTPETRNIILGKPVNIDCRPAIRAFQTGKRSGSMPHVRFLVRGHWKNIVYGPQSSLRRLQQIAPYWKGPDEADIVSRAIKLGNKKDKS
jgi:hypothetical protein